jgi:hypothetical protein
MSKPQFLEMQTVGLECPLPEPNESCDQCSAWATVAVVLVAGRLVFCLHHYTEQMKSKKFTDQLLAMHAKQLV